MTTHGQGGLMDVVLDPDFAINRRLYLSHIWDVEGGKTTAVSTAQLKDNRLHGFRMIFVAQAASDSGRHFGSRLSISRDSKLFVTIGDRGHRPNAQDLSNHAGTILRLNLDGTVPLDNPFVGWPGALPEIWSYGHRNPQGLSIDPDTGRLWSHEHGPRGGDEVNRIKGGRNYGWPTITYGRNYSGTQITAETMRPGMKQPATYWVPSIAPSGLTVYRGDRFPRWDSNLFVGALRARLLVRLEMDGDRVVHEERLITDFDHRIRDVRTGPDGLIYLLLDEPNAAVWRLEPIDDGSVSGRRQDAPCSFPLSGDGGQLSHYDRPWSRDFDLAKASRTRYAQRCVGAKMAAIRETRHGLMAAGWKK